jgi:hypothetical protein
MAVPYRCRERSDDLGRRHIVFIRMRRGLGDGGGTAAVLGALDSVFNPAAARAREDLEAQNERVVAVPSPGDRILADNVIVIEQP